MPADKLSKRVISPVQISKSKLKGQILIDL